MTHAGWGDAWQTPPTMPSSSAGEADPGAEQVPPESGRRRRTSRKQAKRRRVIRRSLLALLGVGVVAGAVGGWLVIDGLRARTELNTAAGLVSTLQKQVEAGDAEGAQVTLVGLQEHAATANAATHGLHWTFASHLPVISDSVRAVQVVSEVVDHLATQALPALLDASTLLDSETFALVDGGIDLTPVETAAPTVIAADEAVQSAALRIASINTDHLLGGLAGPVTEIGAKIDVVAQTTATAARAVNLLPPMFGTQEPRNYLLLVQNTAEARATGGIPGSVVQLRAEDGRVQIVDQRPGNLLASDSPVLPLTDEEVSLFGENLGQLMLDVNFTPDFPRTAQLAKALWEQQVGGTIDGVLSMDPQALALLLGATGPVPLLPGAVSDAVGGYLTAENAAQTLLNTVYLEIENPAEQDIFFDVTAASVFAAVVAGQGNPMDFVEALAQAAREHRMLVWSANAKEQRVLAPTVLSGALEGSDGDSPVVGVYFNDGTAAKMSFYLDTVVTVAQQCDADGVGRMTVDVTMTNTAPANAADLPRYLTGGGRVIPAGQIRTNVLLYAPTGGLIEQVRTSTGEVGASSNLHDGLLVAGRTTQLAPGESITLTYDLVAGPHGGTVKVRTTPLNQIDVKKITGDSCSVL